MYRPAHTCSFPGCGSVLVIDGNMKNYRDVCHAKDAGYIQFEGLQGSIKTGCSASPDYKSRYCFNHKNHACNLLYCPEQTGEDGEDGELDVIPGPALRCSSRSADSGNLVAELILAKKMTRKQTYYQVQICHFSSSDPYQ